MWRKIEEKKPRSAPDLQHAFWFERQNALNCVIHPLAHLFGGNGLARITAIPTADVEGWIRELRGLIKNLIVVDYLPLGQLLFFELSCFDFGVALRDISNQLFITSRVFTR